MKRKHAFLFILALVATPPLLVYGASDHSIPTKTIHFVTPGQTLWDIAAEERPNDNTLKVVYEIQELNGIVDAGSLAVGTELKLP